MYAEFDVNEAVMTVFRQLRPFFFWKKMSTNPTMSFKRETQSTIHRLTTGAACIRSRRAVRQTRPCLARNGVKWTLTAYG